MAFTSVSLPTVAANGAGAAVDVSTFGGLKTVVVSGNAGVFEPAVTIEVALDAGGTEWTPLWTFLLPGEKGFEIACRWMRAVVSNYRGGGAPNVDVGGEDDGTTFANLAALATDGSAAATDVTAMGEFKTVQVGGTFRGTVNVDISTDGGATFRTAFSFIAGRRGAQTQVIACDFMRVTRAGVPLVDPGLPVVNVAAVDLVGNVTSLNNLTVNVSLTSLGITTLSGAIIRAGALTPAALAAGTTNDYNLNPTLASSNRIRQATNAANSALGGINMSQATSGQEWVLENLGPGLLTLVHAGPGSTAAYRFALEGGVDRDIGVNGTVILSYDGTLQRILCVG